MPQIRFNMYDFTHVNKNNFMHVQFGVIKINIDTLILNEVLQRIYIDFLL